ncbi:helix-turn-helix domain-containing protein [Streptomyces sp. NA02950]|uniref:helix-turn-helix domain-containing protein n=1 Tax=Streptomyces sp. NA02950 TaxID=2742137 RepID=UPI00158FC2A2|nr:helix-turn-helix transcriptional regulator [Streptomyces sp. NA02950]QKV92749.1 helix-turn-helix domain-containing protein [Streptomyces sp. NA02950]
MREHELGPLLRRLRESTGRTQQELADDLNQRTGRNSDRHQVSDWERCVIPGPYWREQLADSLGVPVDLLNRAAAASRRRRKLERLSLEGPDENAEGPVDRRKFLGTAAVAASAAAEPWGRLAVALSGGRVDEAAVRQLVGGTADLYTDEEHVPAPLLSARIAAHLDCITAAIPRAGQRRSELIISAGETAALAGWAAWDRGEHAEAAHYFRAVHDAAQETGHRPLEALAILYASYGADNPSRATTMLKEAQLCVKGPGYATAHAWAAAREAEEQARLGQSAAAERAIERARTAYDYASPEAEQPWVRFLRPARLDSMAVSTYTRLGHPEAVAQAQASMDHLDVGNPKVNVAVLCDAAMAHLVAGDGERGAAVARQALDTAVSFNYIGVTMVDVRMKEIAGVLPDNTTARDLQQEIRAAVV